ncbi:hypothetical protein Tco_1155678 [Tanacetum coccineum]
MYRRLPPPSIPYPSGSTKVAVVEELLIERDALLRQLKQSLAQAKNQMVMQANRKRREVEYKIGDMVLVKLQPYRHMTLAKHCSNKLAKRYYGPFEVLERIGKVAYRLALPKASREFYLESLDQGSSVYYLVDFDVTMSTSKGNYIKVSESAQDRELVWEADSKLTKKIYEESFSRHAAWIGGKLIQLMHTTMVPVQVKTMKIQARVQVSRPGELRRHL